MDDRKLAACVLIWSRNAHMVPSYDQTPYKFHDD